MVMGSSKLIMHKKQYKLYRKTKKYKNKLKRILKIKIKNKWSNGRKEMTNKSKLSLK